jgi:two-component system OmpR family response regulator
MDTEDALPLLLAEDDPTSARFLVEALRQLGWAVEHAADGPAALAAARARRHAAWLFDLGLPGLDGERLLRALRETHPTGAAEPLALALSADTSPAQRRRVLAAGFADLLPKPLSIDRLDAALRGLAPRTRSSAAVFDDDAALLALGSIDAVTDLRGLFVRELPAQAARIEAAVAAEALGTALDELHRLHASTRFCGAVALARASDALTASLRGKSDRAACLAAWRDAVTTTCTAFRRPDRPPEDAATTP